MTTYKRTLASGIGILAVVASGATRTPSTQPVLEPVPPVLSDLDQRFLTQFVRRTLAQYVESESLYEAAYVPPALRGMKCHVVVTLRQQGFHRATGTSEQRPVLDACQEAAVVAVTLLGDIDRVSPERLRGLTVELEVVGQAVALPVSADALLAGPIEAWVEPGIHGLVFQLGQTKRRFTPGQFVASNTPLREAALRLAQQLAPMPDGLVEATAARFRTTHWVEREPEGDVIELRRGLVVLAPQDVTAESLSAAVTGMADYLRYRQCPDGRFAFCFEPSNDRYSDKDSPLAQAGAAWALAFHARHAGDSAAATAAERVLDVWTSRIVDLPGVEGAGFVASPDGRHSLGLTAQVCLALSDHPNAGKFREAREKLCAGMLWAQRPTGEFVTAFPPADPLGTQVLYPGEALTALARVYEEKPQQRIMAAFDRAIGFYRAIFSEQPSPLFAAWHVQAFGRMARHSKRADFAEFAFAMADALVGVQLDEHNCPWPDKWGGIAPGRPGDVGAATACYLQGLVEALLLARQVGDASRASRYERAVRSGVRFVMQLQFRPQEAFYVRTPRDVVGGIRASLWDNTLHVEDCQHALIALSRAQQALDPGRTAPRK